VTVNPPTLTFNTVAGAHVLTPTVFETVLVAIRARCAGSADDSGGGPFLNVTLESSDDQLFSILPAAVTFGVDEYSRR